MTRTLKEKQINLITSNNDIYTDECENRAQKDIEGCQTCLEEPYEACRPSKRLKRMKG